ncbi:RsmB/NOP family class I SAM-dependent RNA methyltransferase [Allosphingosinicella sp.]|uniref:RsmB/NOP family class I SAM-dependent RNA methyltransferase n=1 Tax=Allosphingosinicella sp. TaxID=2823234 RepID=UPI003782E9BC
MTPQARLQAAIELVDEIIAAAREGGAAADTLIARYFKTRRYAGAKDRRAVRELVFRAVRRAGPRPGSGRAALLGLKEQRPLFDGSPHGPAIVQGNEPAAEAGIAPHWLLKRLDPLLERTELPALLERAPLDVRVNRLTDRPDVDAEPTPHSPIGLRFPEGTQVEQLAAWQGGQIEVQDEGSQLICLACEATAGATVVDLCAGAGGKSLALAAEMGNWGRLIAADTDRGRLQRLPQRAERAGVTIVESRLLNPGEEAETLADLVGQADLVLVDAPCSGTGTWRRNPETRWRATPDRLKRLTELQARLLDLAATLLKPGGTLVYAVCSLLHEEGRDQAAALSARSSLVPAPVPIQAGRPAGSGVLLTPGHDGTDGFFVARWQAPC